MNTRLRPCGPREYSKVLKRWDLQKLIKDFVTSEFVCMEVMWRGHYSNAKSCCNSFATCVYRLGLRPTIKVHWIEDKVYVAKASYKEKIHVNYR